MPGAPNLRQFSFISSRDSSRRSKAITSSAGNWSLASIEIEPVQKPTSQRVCLSYSSRRDKERSLTGIFVIIFFLPSRWANSASGIPKYLFRESLFIRITQLGWEKVLFEASSRERELTSSLFSFPRFSPTAIV